MSDQEIRRRSELIFDEVARQRNEYATRLAFALADLAMAREELEAMNRAMGMVEPKEAVDPYSGAVVKSNGPGRA